MTGDRLGCRALALLLVAFLATWGAELVGAAFFQPAAGYSETKTASEEAIEAYAGRYRISRGLARTIYVQAREMGVEPDLVFGLVATESRFNPRAVGRRGERGLLQLRLATARAYDRHVTPEALFHSETNLRLGLLHLKREVEHFDHDWRLGLLAYNMGRGRLTRVLEAGREPSPRYAARVMAHVRGQLL
jgi:soluble lytic murein transglycosylase-like protein